jgi:hypothetical protein
MVIFQNQEFQDHNLNVDRMLTAHHSWLVSALIARTYAQWLMSAHRIKSAVFLTHYHCVQLSVSVPQIPLLIAMAVAGQLVSISIGQIKFQNLNMNGKNGRSSCERQGITAFCTCQWNEHEWFIFVKFLNSFFYQTSFSTKTAKEVQW